MKTAETTKTDAMPTELRLAAILSLLSSLALHGVTAGKTAALLAHLEATALTHAAINPHLKQVLEDALADWMSVECHQRSVSVDFCAVAVAGQALH